MAMGRATAAATWMIGLAAPLVGIGVVVVGAGVAARGGEWRDQRVAGPFVCRADFSLADHQPVFADLARLQHDLARQLKIEPPRAPIDLLLFRDRSAYQSYVRRRHPEAPLRQALYIKGSGGQGQVLAYQSREFATDIRHEGTHALLHASLPMVPLWLDEGLAEYFEASPEKREFDHPHLKAVQWNAKLGMAPRLPRLEAKTELTEMSATDYRHAWAWVHFLLHGAEEGRRELVGYLGDIQANSPPGRLSSRLDLRLPDADRRLVEHFKKWGKSGK